MKLLSACLCILSLAKLISSYKILVLFPMPSKSHNILGTALVKGLLEAGHDVTMVTHFENKNVPKGGKYSEVLLDSLFTEDSDVAKKNFFDMESMPAIMQIPFMNWMGNELSNSTLQNPNVQKLLKSNDHYDAVIIQQFLNDAMKILAYHFKAPQILLSSLYPNRWINPLVGNPEPPSYTPDVFTSYSVPMTFCERVQNFLFGLVADIARHFFFFPSQNKIMKEAYPNAPELDEILYNVSLILVNAHESFNQPVPEVPNMINIGGYHIGPAKPLPKDLQDFMDDAKDGVVYFSMGSNLEPSEMPKSTLNILLKTLGKLKQKVLWKWDEPNLPNKPQNVKISTWFPQRDILAHPNCRLFITHGGLLSTTETVYNGVPILALPVLGDQKLNAARAEKFGYGIHIPFSKITEESLNKALTDLLETPKFKENAKRRSAIMHDRLVKPMETAIYWIEYVIRHKGAPHLRVAAVDLPLYQYLLFDVIGFLIFVCIVSILVGYLVVKKLCCKRKEKTDLKLKKS